MINKLEYEMPALTVFQFDEMSVIITSTTETDSTTVPEGDSWVDQD